MLDRKSILNVVWTFYQITSGKAIHNLGRCMLFQEAIIVEVF